MSGPKGDAMKGRLSAREEDIEVSLIERWGTVLQVVEIGGKSLMLNHSFV